MYIVIYIVHDCISTIRCVCDIHVPQVVVDPPPQTVESELKVGSRVWLKEKDLYGFVRYVYNLFCYTCIYMYMYM